MLLHLRNVQKISTWVEIANYFQGRNAKQCAYRYKKIFLGKEKGNWTREEDLKLLELVEYFGENFDKIRSYFPGKQEKEIQSRYFKKINPQIVVFTPEEDRIILKMYYTQCLESHDKAILCKKGAISVKKRLELLLKLRGEEGLDSNFNISDFLPCSFTMNNPNLHVSGGIEQVNNRQKKDDMTEFSIGVTNTFSYIDKDEDDMTFCRKTSDFHEYINEQSNDNIILNKLSREKLPFDTFNLDKNPVRKQSSEDKINSLLKINNETPVFKKDTAELFADNFFFFNNIDNNDDNNDDNLLMNYFCKNSSPAFLFKELHLNQQFSIEEAERLFNNEIMKLSSSSLSSLLMKKTELEATLSNINNTLAVYKHNFSNKLEVSCLPEPDKQVLVELLQKTELQENELNSELYNIKMSFRDKASNINEQQLIQELTLRMDCLMKLVKVAKMKTQLLAKVN